jgi:hypothetical protein
VAVAPEAPGPAKESGGGLIALLRVMVSAPPMAAVAIALAIIAILALPPVTEIGAASAGSSAAEISPFLESVRLSPGEATHRSFGGLGPAWDYLGTPERQFVVEEIGSRLAEIGIENVILTDSSGRVAAHYPNGAIIVLTPKPTDDERL